MDFSEGELKLTALMLILYQLNKQGCDSKTTLRIICHCEEPQATWQSRDCFGRPSLAMTPLFIELIPNFFVGFSGKVLFKVISLHDDCPCWCEMGIDF